MVSKQGENLVDQGSATFYPKNFIDSEKDIAFVLDFKNTPKDLIKQVSISNGKNSVYIPFRYFNADFKYFNPPGTNKYIEGILKTDEKQEYKFRIVLPWRALTWIINDDQGTKIVNNLILKGQRQRSKIRDIKLHNSNQFSALLVNSPLLLEANLKTGTAQALYISTQDNYDLKQAEYINESQNHKKWKDELEKKRNEINPLESQIEISENKLKTLSLELEESFKILKQTSNQNSSANFNKETIEKKIDEAKKFIDINMTDLNKLAPEKKVVIDEYKDALITLNKDKEATTSNKIRSME